MTKLSNKEIWAHNRMIGQACSFKYNAQKIVDARSTTDESRALATELLDKAIALEASLRRRRRDQE
jgi:hypothetical protein